MQTISVIAIFAESVVFVVRFKSGVFMSYEVQMISRELRRIGVLARRGSVGDAEAAIEGLEVVKNLILTAEEKRENREENGNSGNKKKVVLKRAGAKKQPVEDGE